MTYPNATHYSPHFSRQELDCRCGCKTPPAVAANLVVLAGHLEELRAHRGGPLIIDDAYRCPTRNKLVGGVPDSQHMLGRAADVAASELSVPQLAALAAQVPAFNQGGIGTYPREVFVHLDFRGHQARWSG